MRVLFSLFVATMMASSPYNFVSADHGSKGSKGSKGASDYCEVMDCADENGYFHMFLGETPEGDPIESFPQAIKATPENCVLAPINSEKDVLAVFGALPSPDTLAYVGIYKDLEDYTSGAGSNAAWNNVDGSDVPETDDIWFTNEPNAGGPGAELFAVTYEGALADIASTGGPAGLVIDGAVYKCCYAKPLMCSII